MADFSNAPVAATSTEPNRFVDEVKMKSKVSYWKRMLENYERRNATLERRHSALAKRVRFMECTLPSLLVGAAASTAYDKQGIPNAKLRASENIIKSIPRDSN